MDGGLELSSHLRLQSGHRVRRSARILGEYRMSTSRCARNGSSSKRNQKQRPHSSTDLPHPSHLVDSAEFMKNSLLRTQPAHRHSSSVYLDAYSRSSSNCSSACSSCFPLDKVVSCLGSDKDVVGCVVISAS